MAALASAVALAAAACSSARPEGSAPECDASDPGCAAPVVECTSNSECPGAQCVSGVCAAEPACEGADCGSSGAGGSFNDTVLTDDFGDLETDQDASEPAECVELAIEFERVTPTVVLLIDQSGSMTQNFDGGKDRWETLRDTLGDPETSMLNALDSSVRFGMVLYTSNNGFGTRRRPQTCPLLKEVDIALDSFEAMSDMLSESGPRGDTPTAESLEAVTANLLAFGEQGPKSIILATDGDPDTCEDPDANDQEGSKQRSVEAVRAAFEQGITTHVISVGDEVTESHLKDLAEAGAGGDSDAVAHTALDTTQLVDAFDDIIGRVRTCDFEMQGTVEARNASRGTVALDGEPLVYQDPNGWEMPNEHTVRLLGEACERARADAASLDMSFPCDAIRFIPR